MPLQNDQAGWEKQQNENIGIKIKSSMSISDKAEETVEQKTALKNLPRMQQGVKKK